MSYRKALPEKKDCLILVDISVPNLVGHLVSVEKEKNSRKYTGTFRGVSSLINLAERCRT